MNQDELMTRLVEQRPQFLGFLTRQLRSSDAAEDVLQEAFARAVDQVGSLRDESRFSAWFYRILHNGVVDYQRRTGARQRAAAAFSQETDSITAATERSVRACSCITHLSEALKPEYQSALTRVEVDGLPVKDFALEQGISANNAAVRVFRARRALRDQVIACCGACATDGCQDCTCHGNVPSLEKDSP
jgi:RNA polymerase sigma-70 factor (ECF subfamily)